MEVASNSRVRITSLNRIRRTRALQIDLADIQRAEDIDEAADVQNEPTDLDILLYKCSALQMLKAYSS